MIVATSAVLSGCGDKNPKNYLDQILNEINSSIAVIRDQSTAWKNELPKLEDQLGTIVSDAEGTANADLRALVTGATSDMRSLAEDTLKLAAMTAEQVAANFGAELRCNADFARTRVTSTLNDWVSRIQFWKAHAHQLPDPPPHAVCQVTPNSMEVRATGNTTTPWAVRSPSNKIVSVYGYDFRADATPTVQLRNSAGAVVRTSAVKAQYVTRYQLNIDMSVESLTDLADGDYYALVWPDAPELNSIAIQLVQPAALRILGVAWNKSPAQAIADFVYPTVTVQNTGGSASEKTTLRWLPGPGLRPVSTDVNGLAPGERTTVVFGGAQYPHAGTFDTQIVFDNGSDSHKAMITILPYEDTPRTVETGIQGSYDGKSETTKTIDGPPVHLDKDCVIDPTRGGGRVDIHPGDHKDWTFTLAWPSGYDFQFSDHQGGTFWSSLKSVDVQYDSEGATVLPIVTVRRPSGDVGDARFNGKFVVYEMCPS